MKFRHILPQPPCMALHEGLLIEAQYSIGEISPRPHRVYVAGRGRQRVLMLAARDLCSACLFRGTGAAVDTASLYFDFNYVLGPGDTF